MKWLIAFVCCLVAGSAGASPAWFSYGPPSGAECVLGVARLEEALGESEWRLPKDVDLVARCSLDELDELSELLEEGAEKLTGEGKRRVRLEIDLGGVADPVAVRRKGGDGLEKLTRTAERTGCEGPFFVADSEKRAACRNALLLNEEGTHPSELVAREVRKDVEWTREGTPGLHSEWIADLLHCPPEKRERSSNRALGWGAQGCLVPETALSKEDLWVWRNLAPFQWVSRGVGLMGDAEGVRLLERAARESHLGYLYASGTVDLDACGAVLLMGDPGVSRLEGLEERVEEGLLLVVFMGTEPQDAVSSFLRRVGVELNGHQDERVPSFVKRAEDATLGSWEDVRVRSLKRPSRLPKDVLVEAEAPDGREAGWSWSRDKGRIFLLQSPEEDEASIDVLKRWMTSVGGMAGCTPALKGASDVEGTLLRSEGQLFLMLRAEGTPGGLLRCRAALPWAKKGVLYRFWERPGHRWVGFVTGEEALSEGISLEVPMGGTLLLQVSEHERED